jgi:TP901 family phage tail tape measure protein
MAQENLVTNIVAKSNFSDLIGDLSRVSSKLVSLQQNLNATNKSLAVQAAQMQKSFSDTMRSTGQFSTHFTSVQNDVEKFGRGLDSGRLKLGQYYGAWREHSRTAGGLIRDLARQQVQLQNSVLQPLGKNAQGIMQYAVHVPRGLDAVRDKSALASQELKIMNRVVQDGATGLINWGKNTQWAGRQLSVGLTLPIALFGKTAATAFREADEQLVRLTKVYGGVAATSAVELAKVRKEVAATARELSAAYGASYKDTIGLAADIAATGKEGEELLNSTREATRLSILGEVDRQDAMKATLSIQTAFKQNTAELAESINFLNAVENQTSTSLADLVEAIPKAGPVVKALGGDVQDLALYLTAMREGGINASEGANALKSALASIIGPTKVAKEMFLGLGIDLTGIVDKNAGNLTGTIMALKDSLDSLEPLQRARAIEQLFGKFQFARISALFENLGKQGSQTLQVLDLMKTSSADLANIAGRELAAITESASGKYRRALETLKADLAGVGEQFLNIGTKIINVLGAIIRFFNKLPDPIKKILTFVAGLTAIAGPIIMLTGLFANFFGYIAKGLFHLRALIKGGEGFKLLTPEIVAAQKAGQIMETQFYDDAKAAAVLKQAISNLTNELRLLEVKANAARVAVGPAISTMAGSVITPGQGRIANPQHPLIGQPYTRSFAHLNPVAGMTQEERLAQTIFGVAPNPQPLNRKISNNPQMYMDSDLPRVDRVSSAKGFSTGIVAAEAAKWHSMTAALAMQSKEEIALLKSEVAATGAVTTSLSTSYQALLPEMTRITSLAAQEGALIVKQLEAGKLTVDQARAKIIALNAQIEAMMAQSAQMIATQHGRTLALSTVPLTRQPIVDPLTGKSNMKELFHKGPTASLVNQIARNLGVRTSGGGYSIETTMPRVSVARFLKRNKGGDIETFGPNKTTVSGPSSITYDDRLGSIPLGGYVLNQKASLANPELAALAPMTYNKGGNIVAELTPQETVFGPGIRAIPGLYQAVDAANRGQNVGGTITPGRKNYGIRYSVRGRSIVDTKTIEKLWRQVFGKGGKAPKEEYEPKGTSGFFGGDVATKLGERISTTRLNQLLDGDGVAPNILLASIMSRASRGRLSTDVFLKGLRDAGTISAAEERRLSRLIFTKYASTIKGMPLVNDRNNPIHSVSDSVIRQELGNLKNRADVERLWTEFSRQPGSFADATRRSSSNFLTTLTAGDKTIKLDRLEGTGKEEKFFHAKSTDNPMYAEIARMHARQPFGENPGGLPASRLADLTSRWKPIDPMSPLTQRHDWTNTDPLHGPLFIGRQDVGSEGVRRSISYRLPKNEFGKGDDLVGLSPMMSSDPRYLIERYMQGDKAVMSRMQYEQSRGLNTHPLSIQSLFRSVAKPFRGKLYRGMTHQSLSDTFPKHIVEAIEKARAAGDFSSLIGRDFIMRRASFTANPFIASYFAPGQSTGPMSSLLMEARLFGRKVTPTSEMFPDIKFEAPYRQNWSTNREPLRRRSEEESLVGGKFTITGFDGKKLIVEGRAMGGAVSGATPYMVGEQGPELFVPQSSGKIIPNRYMAGGEIISGRSAYGLSGNPAIRAQQLAERAARAASYVPAVVPAQPRAASPFSVGRGTTVGLGGVRTNVYGAQGSLPYMPGLTLGHTPMNMLSDSIQRTTVGIKMMGDSAATAYAKAGVQMTIAQQKMITSINTMGIKIVDSVKLMGNTINTAATNMATGIKAAAATAKASMSAFAGMANPGYAAGFGQNFKYGTSLMMMPFGRRSPQIDPSTGAPRVSNMGGGMMGSMATWMGGSVAGGAVGKKAGGETGALVGSIAGPLAIMGVLKLINSFRTLRFAGIGAGVALKTALGVIGRFIPIIGPLLSIGQLLWVWKRRSEDIGKSNRAVFGPTKKSLEEVGLKYKSLNDRLKDHRQQLELTRAKAAAYGQGGTQIAGLTLSLKELKAGIKDAKENAKESVQLFNMSGGGKEVNELAVSLKQQYVSAGMSVQEATNQIYVLIKASKYGSQALEAISSKSFKSITDQASAADYALNLVAKNLSSGNFNAEEIAVGVQNIINSLDQYKSSLIGTKIDGDIISDAEALKLVLDKIEKSKAANLKLDKETLNNLKKQNIELNYVLNKNETLASTYAKIALLQNPIGEKLDLYAMDPKEAIDIARGAQVYSEAIEETVNKDLSLDKTIKKFENMAKAASKAAAGVNSVTYDNIIKQQNAIIKQLDKELQLRLKNLDAQEKAADFATNLKKEQLNYQKALMSGDMVAAAEAKLNIQQLEKENEIMLAKQAIQDATDKKKEAAQKKADEAQKKKDLLGEAAQSAQNASIDANTAATAFATFESTINRLVGRIGPDETLSATEKTILRTGLKDALDALKQSGKSGLDFVKNFTEQKMGKDQGISYLQGLANDSGDLAGSEKFAGKFASAVDLFFTAVQEFSGGKAYFSAPKDETRDIRFGADKVAMIFEGGGKSYGVITNKADSGKTYITWAEAGYKFRGYDKNYAKKGLVSPDMDQTTDRRTPPKLAMGGAIPGYADGGSYAPGMGGYIRGAGTPTSDSILLPTGNGGLIRASDTEFMQPASSVSYYGKDFMEDIRARRLPREVMGYAMGGAIPGYNMGGNIAPMSASNKIAPKKKDNSPEPGTLSAMLAAAESMVGYVEGEKDNDTIFGDFANKKYNLGSRFISWCGAFMNWVAQQAGVNLDSMVWTPGGAASFKQEGRFNKLNPSVGDLAFFNWTYDNKVKDRIQHVGLVRKVLSGSLVQTIEGNTSEKIPPLFFEKDYVPQEYDAQMRRIRDGVFVRDRLYGDSEYAQIVGFGRPKYKGEDPRGDEPVRGLINSSGKVKSSRPFKISRFAMGGAIPGYAMGGAIPGYNKGGKTNKKKTPSGWDLKWLDTAGPKGYKISRPPVYSNRVSPRDPSLLMPRPTSEGLLEHEFGTKSWTFDPNVSKMPNWTAPWNRDADTEPKPISMFAMGGAIPGYHEGGPVGHRHGRNAPSTSSSPKGSWWDKLGSKMTYKDGVLNPAGMLGFGIMDMIKSLGAVALGSMAQGIFPARERDIASAAETTFVGPISRLLGSKRFPNPWGESGMGMSSGWAKGMDVATILSAIIPFGFAARTSQQTAANASLGSAVRTPGLVKPKTSTPMSNKSLAEDAAEGGYSTGVMDTPKGMPVPFDPLYLAYLEQIGRRPFTITGGGSSARRGLIKSTNKLFSALYEGKRLDLLPTPRAFKFTKSDHYDSSIEEIQLHQKIGSKNPAYLKNPKGRIGPEFPTFIHEMGHAWDLGSAAGGRSRSIFKERFPSISPEAKTMSFQQDDVYSGIKEGTADWYLNEVFPLLKDKIPPAYAEQFSRRLSRSYVSGAGKLTVRDILAPGGAYLKKDGKINPGRQHQVTKDFLSGYLDSSTHLVPEVRSALERTLEILEKFHIGRSTIIKNRQVFGYPDSMSMEDILTDRLTQAFNYADMHGLAMGGAVNPTYSANMSVPTYQMGGMIPKFHNGGQVNTKFAGGETMALLKDKEMVFTQDQMAALGSITSTPNQSVPTSITYAPVINAAPGMDEEMLANLVMVKLGTATNIRYKANGSSGMRVIK